VSSHSSPEHIKEKDIRVLSVLGFKPGMTASSTIHSSGHGMPVYSTIQYGSIDMASEHDDRKEKDGEFYYAPIKLPPASRNGSSRYDRTALRIGTTTITEAPIVALSCGAVTSSSQGYTECEAVALYSGSASTNHENQESMALPTQSLSDYLFAGLGFSSNPFSAESDGIRNTKASDLRLTMLSNFSTAYNLVSISLALSIMEGIYHGTPQDKSLCSSALIAGMIVGQLLGGIIGDVLGRHLAMAVVMCLQVVGATATAFSMESSSSTVEFINIYVVLAFWRFLLGLGCGGVYPLAATITAESNADTTNKADASKLVALSFSMQGVGYFVTPLVGWVLVSILGDDSDLAWRLLLGFGAMPGLLLMFLRMRRQLKLTGLNKAKGISGGSTEVPTAHLREIPVSVVDAIVMEDDLLRKLLGTAACWFVFDVLFYANVLFQPVVLSAAFGPTESIEMAALDTVMVSSMALPGYFVSVLLIGKQSPRFIQAQGFLMMGILYSFIGLVFHDLSHHKFLMIGLYGSTFFFSNYGPNATTYVLPSMTFSKSCRATMNGVCAASGKAGALVGTMVFAMAADRFGQPVVMLVSAALSFVGVALTLTCVSELLLAKQSKEEEDREAAKRTTLPMKIVYSEACMIDYCDSAS
jgi:MFS transporter, PHS family, inorganic phosphate transporter